MTSLTCPNPLDQTLLADYWLNLLVPVEEKRIEEHLMACDFCGARLAEIVALAGAIRDVVQKGNLRVVTSESFLTAAESKDLRVRQYAPANGGHVDCTITADDDFLVTRLAADFSAARQVDLAYCDETGAEQFRMRDIPFRSDADQVILTEPTESARALLQTVLVIKLLSVDDQGERLLGSYTFHHTPS